MSELQESARGAISFAHLAEIAVGATARVDLCRANDGRLLAVKRLHPHIAEDPGFATQFLDEVWMTASLKHPNVVEVAGWGTDMKGSYLAVELVPGVSLARLMKTVFETGEQFNERMVVYIGAKIAAGLTAAHNLRSPDGELLALVHRDLTPGNVLLGFDGDVKIADFGLAKAKLRLTKTMTGVAKGQPTYMAPEQAKSLDIDKRADLFSFGVVLFELFAGRRPWVAGTDYDMVQQTLNDPPADLRELRPKIDKELVAVINKCLEKNPVARFQSAEEIEARLDSWLRVHGYLEDSREALARFVRRNAMRQMRWFDRAVAGELAPREPTRVGRQLPARGPPATSGDDGFAPQARAQAPSNDASMAREAHARIQTPPRAPAAAQPERRLREDPTDVSNAGQKAAVRHAQQSADAARPRAVQETRRGEPVIREVSDSNEWAEEVPTLVQKEGPVVMPTAAPIGRRRPGGAPDARVLPNLVDEESDSLRTTSVRQHGQGDARSNTLPSTISDMDSEELPTMPVAGSNTPQPGKPIARRAPQMQQPAAGARPGTVPPPAGARPRTEPPPAGARPGTIPPPGGARPRTEPPPPPRLGSSAPPPLRPYVAGPNTVTRGPRPLSERTQDAQQQAAAQRRGSSAPPRPPPVSDTAQNGGGALARNAVEAVRAAVLAATAEQARGSFHQHQDIEHRDRGPHRHAAEDMSPMPNAMRRPPVEPPPAIDAPSSPFVAAAQAVVQPAQARPHNQEMLQAEADRLAIEAVRRSEEAKAAQIRADRKMGQAKLAGEAALLAAEAARMTRTMNFAAALARLDEAYEIERRMLAGLGPAESFSNPRQEAPNAAPEEGGYPRDSRSRPQFALDDGGFARDGHARPQPAAPSVAPAQPSAPPPSPQGFAPMPMYALAGQPPVSSQPMPGPMYAAQLSQRIGFNDNNQLASGEIAAMSFGPPQASLPLRIRAIFAGTPAAKIAALAAGAFAIVFLLLWLIFG